MYRVSGERPEEPAAIVAAKPARPPEQYLLSQSLGGVQLVILVVVTLTIGFAAFALVTILLPPVIGALAAAVAVVGTVFMAFRARVVLVDHVGVHC